MPEWMTGVDLQMPAEKLLGVRVLDAAPGVASGVQAAPAGTTLSLGWFGVLTDAMGGRPVAFALPDRHSLSTVSMHLDLVGVPDPSDFTELAGAGRMLELGRSWALSAVTITGADSRVLAVGTVRFLTYPLASTVGRPPVNGTGHTGEVAEPPLDAAGLTVDATGGDDSLLTLLGLRVDDATEGRARLTFTPADRHANPFPVVHGGLHTALVDAAMTAALGGIASAAGMTLLSLDLTFHRPIPVGEWPVSVTASVVQHGRRSALVEACIGAPTGKALTTARGTFGRLDP